MANEPAGASNSGRPEDVEFDMEAGWNKVEWARQEFYLLSTHAI